MQTEHQKHIAKMTFAEFKATRHEGSMGYSYLDGRSRITKISGGFMLQLPSGIYAREDLESLEAMLFAWEVENRPAVMIAVTTEVSQFGHHPNPATDFCVEVEALLGEIKNHQVGFTNGTPTREEMDRRIERAMAFKVGGDTSAIAAKGTLRDAIAKHWNTDAPSAG